MSAGVPPSGITVRDVHEDDLGAVHAIYAHHVLNGLGSFELKPPSAGELRQRMEAILDRGLPYIVAHANGPLGGFAYASSFRPRQAYRFTVEDSVYVAPGMERRGIGRALLAELIARCSARGMRQMIAVIGDSGNLASIELHERLGFTRTGLLPSVGFKAGRWVDIVLMQRGIGEGANTLPER
jgi:L-amino acid N-acyltransferase YncA